MAESDDAWAPPGEDSTSPPPSREPKDVSVLLSEQFDDLKANVGSYLAAGFGFVVITVGIILVIMTPVVIAAILAESLDETTAAVTLGISFLWYVGGIVLFQQSGMALPVFD